MATQDSLNTHEIIEMLRTLPADAQATIEAALLTHRHPLPEWSTLDAPVVHVDKTCHAGAFAWGYYLDTERRDPQTGRMGELMIVLSRRGKEMTADGQPKYSATGGGYRELGGRSSPGEQPDENVARELAEETRNDENQSMLHISPARFHEVLKVGVDYRRPQMPVDYVGYALSLTKEEYQAIVGHGERMQHDAAYQASVFKHTHGEVAGYEALPLSKALKLLPDQFAHPHELEALQKLSEVLTDRARGASRT